jgi:hypothetical protein
MYVVVGGRQVQVIMFARDVHILFKLHTGVNSIE